jgi:hypothetical protein
MSDDKSIDVLGIKPLGEAINTATKGLIDGASAFLGRICLPVAEEFGLLLRDKVSNWRAQQMAKIVEKTQRKLEQAGAPPELHAHPRLVSAILEHGSWEENEDVQEMWAGLLSSSCSADGRDDSNLIFINLLSQLSSMQARILDYSCTKAKKGLSETGLIIADWLVIDTPSLVTLAQCDDIHRLDRELDHLRTLGLLTFDSGFSVGSVHFSNEDLVVRHGKSDALEAAQIDQGANVTPTPVALHMFVRCQGSSTDPIKFFDLQGIPMRLNPRAEP